MRFTEQEQSIAHHIAGTPGLERLRELSDDPDRYARENIAAVLSAVARFASEQLQPLNAQADREGCTLVDGRVRTPAVFRRVMKDFVAQGWPGLSATAAWGGHDLPLVLQAGCQELLDRGCASFGMLPGLFRSGSRVLEAHASEALKAEWLPRLATGEWGATICISEPDAGSDVGRTRSSAVRGPGADWLVTGEKIWITFGDHDLVERIGHCMLARSDPASKGVHGLSLFLVPDFHADAAGKPQRNAIHVRRLEEKLGLHASPTCALGFEGARAHLVGTEGKGLQALFAMIGSLRMSVAVQSLGIASGALATAMAYAAQRRQGGSASAPPVPIASHADVQRMLMDSAARVEVVRGLALTLAVTLELQEYEPDQQRRQEATDLCAWLMPIVKTWGADTAFEVSHTAIQVLGGAGYTRDWPVEQALRDARVFSIYEGTSGIQALDLLHRRLWRDEGRGLAGFLRLARADAALAGSAEPALVGAVSQVLALLESCARELRAERTQFAEAGAAAFLQLAGIAAASWIALRLVLRAGADGAARKASAAGRYWLAAAPTRARCAHDEALLGEQRLATFEVVAAPFE
ncbi:MAG: acyl-CoA dehydrogenase [Ramlibacter sp.]|nr:acyl-CoA dehydrogenase [Ramlibacter sp.]